MVILQYFIRFTYICILSIALTPASYASSKVSDYLSIYFEESRANYATAARDLQKFIKQNHIKFADNEILYGRLFANQLRAGRYNKALQNAANIAKKRNEYQELAQIMIAANAIKTQKWVEDDNIASLLKGGTYGALLARFIKVWGYASNKQYAKAISIIERSLDGNKDGTEDILRYHLVSLYLLDKQYDKAISFLTKNKAAIALSPPMLRLYVRALQAQDKNKEARQALSNYIQLKTENSEDVHNDIKEDFKKISRNDSLKPIIKNAHQGLADAIYHLSLYLVGRFDVQALSYAQIGLYADNKSAALYALIGDIYLSLNNPKEALRYFAFFKKQHPLYKNIIVSLANYYYTTGNKELALKHLENLYKMFSDDRDITIRLANFYRYEDNCKKAIALYRDIIIKIDENKPKDWDVFYYRGICYEQLKNWSKAEKDLLTALELKPDDPYILNYLGYSWVDRGEHIERAFDMIQDAVAQRQNDGYITDSLGWAFYKMKRYNEAVPAMERAVALEPNDPIITDHLGDVYWHVGRKKEAYFMWKRALFFAKDEELKQQLQQKIELGLDAFLQQNSDV